MSSFGRRWRRVAPALCIATSLACSAPSPRTNVVLVVIDTLRADRVSSYGYARPTTPGLDTLAVSGIRFANAFSTSSWTLPAHASLFTGTHPIEHRATQEHTFLTADQKTLAEILSESGYATFAATGNGVINEASGLVRGFAEFLETWRGDTDRSAPPPSKHPNTLAMRGFLERADEPFFVFVNYVEVHAPYRPPEPHRSQFLSDAARSVAAAAGGRKASRFYLDPESISKQEFQALSDLYDAEVAYADALVSALVDELRKAERLDDTLLIVTSDHGENLGDHGHYKHVFSLYDTTVRIPLIVRLPGGARAGEVIEQSVSLVDVFATVLAAAGVADPRVGRGRDLLAAADLEDVPIFAEYYYPLQALDLFGGLERARELPALELHLRRLRAVGWQGHRLIWSSDGRHELYDVRADPDQERNLAATPPDPEMPARLQHLLDEFVRSGGGPRPLPEASPAQAGAFGDVDAETAAQLRELGYLAE